MGATRSFFQSILYSDKALCFHHRTDLVSAHCPTYLRPCGNRSADSGLFYRKGFSWRISRSYLHSQFFFPLPIVRGLRLLSISLRQSSIPPPPGTLSSSIPPFLKRSVPVRPHRPLLAEPPTQSANRYRTRLGGLCGWVACRYTSIPRSLFRFFFPKCQ